MGGDEGSIHTRHSEGHRPASIMANKRVYMYGIRNTCAYMYGIHSKCDTK